MKTQEEAAEAYELLVAVLHGEIKVDIPMPKPVKDQILGACQALQWIIDPKAVHAKSIEDLLSQARAARKKVGDQESFAA